MESSLAFLGPFAASEADPVNTTEIITEAGKKY